MWELYWLTRIDFIVSAATMILIASAAISVFILIHWIIDITKTIDVDDGVTPYAFTCDYCGNPFATSTMYNDIAPKQKPTHEWYRPSLKETLKWRSKNTQMLEHILNGGLDVRPIKQE